MNDNKFEELKELLNKKGYIQHSTSIAKFKPTSCMYSDNFSILSNSNEINNYKTKKFIYTSTARFQESNTDDYYLEELVSEKFVTPSDNWLNHWDELVDCINNSNNISDFFESFIKNIFKHNDCLAEIGTTIMKDGNDNTVYLFIRDGNHRIAFLEWLGYDFSYEISKIDGSIFVKLLK